ncbi:MAG: EF-Tu/IF-2/RF-3 family GTPase, partial [bacterium]|nr:EF-Tu/IF-2/RF-3 family GTPase [bacterium]
EEGKDLKPFFDAIIEKIPAPRYEESEPFQMIVCNIGYSDYTGRLAIGRVMNGHAEKNNQLVCLEENNKIIPLRVSKLQVYKGITHEEVDTVSPGEIVVLSGVEEVQIGDTICNKEHPKAYKRITVDEPTIAMSFMVNTSPLSGTEGTFVQSARIWERLQKETLYNVAIKVERSPTSDVFIVKGRGELQLAILIEQMRREGFELAVGRPRILFKEKDGKKLEPMEHVVIDADSEFAGIITEKLGQRRGIMVHMNVLHAHNRTRLEFKVPSRGLIGYRNEFLTDTKGTGIINSSIEGYEEMKGPIERRKTGSLIADRLGQAVPYGMWYLEERGRLFVLPGTKLYEGMIVGEHSRDNDLMVNLSRTKKLTNIRTTSKDEAVTLTPIQPFTLEQAIEFINDDELVEVTPKSIRMRKAILNFNERKIAEKKS